MPLDVITIREEIAEVVDDLSEEYNRLINLVEVMQHQLGDKLNKAMLGDLLRRFEIDSVQEKLEELEAAVHKLKSI